jgi:quercetin dioxygenase-like cupin family protein
MRRLKMPQKFQIRLVLGAFLGLVLALALSVVPVGHAQQPAAPQSVTQPAAAQAAQPAAPNLFTGKSDTLPTEGVVSMGRRFFAAGARSGWQRQGGQLVYAEKGHGLLGWRGKPAQRLAPGESAFIPAGVEHWHGAASNEDFYMLFVTYADYKDSPSLPPVQRVTDQEYANVAK